MSEVFPFHSLAPRERYKMLCATVIPRPVAWVTSLGAKDQVNAAPYSFFNVFSEDPALVILGIDRNAAGAAKDTLANAEAKGEFTVNLTDIAMAEAMVATAASFPPEVSEVDTLGLATEPGETVDTPRLKNAPISLECRLFAVQSLHASRSLLLGEVSALVAKEGLFDPTTHRLTVGHWNPVARLYASSYAALGDPFDLPIPDWSTLGKADAP